jgi:hypothetical protein
MFANHREGSSSSQWRAGRSTYTLVRKRNQSKPSPAPRGPPDRESDGEDVRTPMGPYPHPGGTPSKGSCQARGVTTLGGLPTRFRFCFCCSVLVQRLGGCLS